MAEGARPAPRAKHSQTRRDRRRNEAHTGPTNCAPDLEQLIQERREAIHTAATISASPLISGSDTQLSQPVSDRPLTPDCLSESALVGAPCDAGHRRQTLLKDLRTTSRDYALWELPN
ncbi:hypothetical protein NDU88_003313 [Pleurodeles waltl]|uniref:Uncharacterized protein n=1 Tax=Pleurodeles waltl TaxID=8319 RepID=A0AAV7W5M2_PLEWA|nr:hypothetical protein NDU88_003313 [Pleurodeles waltl]